MINKLIVHAPLNSLSLGQFSYNVVRELYRRKIQCTIFPHGNVDLSAFKNDPQFGQWLERSINERLKRFDRNVPTLALWHINGSEFKISDKQYLFTFHETDGPTEHEVNIVNQQNHTFFSSSWSVNNFQTYGAANTSFIPLGLDEDFTIIPHRQIDENITHWGLVGKAEQRKNTQLIISTWVKKYGGDKKNFLTICIENPFFPPEHMNAFYNACFGGAPKPFNVNVLPRIRTNVEMNQLYNSFDIDLSGFSSSEGWNLPAFTATALGKWSIVSDCTAHKDWATDTNSILVKTEKLRPVYDGVFFQQNTPFSQGNIYSLSEEQLVEAFARAEKLSRTPNKEGLELGKTLTYKNTVDKILEKIV